MTFDLYGGTLGVFGLQGGEWSERLVLPEENRGREVKRGSAVLADDIIAMVTIAMVTIVFIIIIVVFFSTIFFMTDEG